VLSYFVFRKREGRQYQSHYHYEPSCKFTCHFTLPATVSRITSDLRRRIPFNRKISEKSRTGILATENGDIADLRSQSCRVCWSKLITVLLQHGRFKRTQNYHFLPRQ
jgi:hypothetical protein